MEEPRADTSFGSKINWTSNPKIERLGLENSLVFVYFGSLFLSSLFIFQTGHYQFYIPVSLRERRKINVLLLTAFNPVLFQIFFAQCRDTHN